MKFEYDVYLCYTHDDYNWALMLKNSLEKKGITVWFDEKDGRPGDHIIDAIEKGMKNTKNFIIIVSPESLKSGWVKYEYKRAITIRISENEISKNDEIRRIIPVILRDAEVPNYLMDNLAVDFREDSQFESSLRKLIWGLKGELIDISSVSKDHGPLPLEEIMLEAKQSLIISGHTLNKFCQNTEVKNALGILFKNNVNVKLILLNPYSDYCKAHEPFHGLGKKKSNSAYEQIISTIIFFKRIFKAYNHPKNFEIYLSNYMPRFRTIIIDHKLIYVSLYLYHKDVDLNPEFRLERSSDSISSFWFKSIYESIEELLNSNSVLPLIKNGYFNQYWPNWRLLNLLNKYCIKNPVFKNFEEGWNEIKKIVLGYQNDDIYHNNKNQLWNRDFQPGTFTIDKINPEAKFLYNPTTFDNWLNDVLKDEFKLIKKIKPSLWIKKSKRDIIQKVNKILNFTGIMKNESIRHEIWFQEYPDILRRIYMTIIAGNPDYNINLFPNLTYERKDFILDLIKWIDKFKKPNLRNWLHLSIAAGILGIDEKSFHAATSVIKSQNVISLNSPEEDYNEALFRVGNSLWDTSETRCRIDASNLFFHTLDYNQKYIFNIVSFPDDYFETIFLLKFYEELLNQYQQLEIDFIPRSIRCGNDACYDDVIDFLNNFDFLKNNRRFRVIENGPVIGGVNLKKLHPTILTLIQKAKILDIRGARSYEMMQGVNKEIYFGFMVSREISESVTGLNVEDFPLIFLHQNVGDKSFKNFENRHFRKEEDNRMFSTLTAKEQKLKWEGGYLSNFNKWTEKRQDIYKIVRTFYSDKAIEFNWKFGKDIERDVMNFLDLFSGRVLVLGCGSGKEVNYLSIKGCEVYGIDFSYEAIELAKKENPELKNQFIVEDLYNLEFIMDGKFNGIVANAALVHLIEREDIKYILKKIFNKLEGNGLCYIRVLKKEGLTDEFDDRLFGGLRYFVYFSLDELTKYSIDMGFIIESSIVHKHIKYDNVEWVSLFLRKPNK